ncbi:MAG: hypothetical protein FJ398_13505 [Verrucomicrobia bacterium]|nr:hypothetical protein [Verrucomicrobiota bacterium]
MRTVAVDHFPALQQQSQSVLAPGNLLLLYAGIVLLKTLHEFGHAYFCRRFGGEVHVLGVMLMIFTPIPYMDATSSWGFRSRWQRILVGAAGMIVELFVAALATFVWANTGQGTLHSLAYNMMLAASVSTLVFNLNPLLRFDGYYMLSDLLEIPNLHQRALQQLKHVVERYGFGVEQSESPARTRGEAGWLAAFGVASGIYRVFVFGAILLFVADRYLLLGVLMAAFCVVSWILVPMGKLLSYLASSPRLARHRPRAVLATLGVFGFVLLLLNWVPMPSHFRAPGVLQADQSALIVRARHDGVWVAPQIEDSAGRWLARGTELGVVVNASSFEFLAPVSQTDGEALFGRRLLGAEVRLFGQSGTEIPIDRWKVIPAERERLPSAALGWAGGGDVPVAPTDPQGQRALEPFFEVRADVKTGAPPALLHGRSGKIRFDLAPEPLLPRWIRRVRQLLQQRYQA